MKDYTMKVILFLFTICAAQGAVHMVGGFREIPLEDVPKDPYLQKEIDTGLQIAATRMNAVKTANGTKNEKPLKILQLLQVFSQVVSGVNYKLVVKVDIDGQNKTCGMCVTHLAPWLNGGTWLLRPCSENDPCSPFIPRDHPRSPRSVSLLGGPHEVDTNDNMAQQAAQWAVEHINKMSNSLFMQSLLKVTHATEQVINGLRYHFLLTTVFTSCRNAPENHHKTLSECLATTESKPQECDVSVIYSQNKYTMENFKCKPHREAVENVQKRSAVARMEILGGDNHDYLPHGDDKCAEHVPAFKEFKIQYDRLYGSPAEEARRFKIFCDNMEKVKIIQSVEQGSAQYGATKFADLSEEEFKKMHLGFKPPVSLKRQWPQAKIPEGPIPDSWDWREHNAVTPVKNQGWCGSCWAFSTTGNIEGQWAINSPSHQLLSLSEQELVDCDKLDQGCNGGFMYDAYEAIKDLGGIETETDYKYTGEDGKCQFNKSEVVAKVTGAVNISKNEEDMAAWLYKNGPISIGINSFPMQFYKWGIAHPWKFFCDPNALDHGVLIVGYGKKGKEPYWIIKNSWGSNWGREGYYYIYRGDGSCGLNTMCSSATVA
ncbi:unnamed protein product [Candidula unifasciata]|uniref:Cathepsin F n=1 Tax=Candidula unifasciata TaxID=100452 RepID=A0A8S4A1J9_9EUPU|nr:unnamed protein product [Candidula unifasciata]